MGTGFHPELTGRENACPPLRLRTGCLNGAILGMTKAETCPERLNLLSLAKDRPQIRRGLPRRAGRIADFSGVEKFIDTPAKRYSSGMRVRLAFSVAAHPSI